MLLPPKPRAWIEAVEKRASPQLLSVARKVAAKRFGRPGDLHPGGVVKVVDPDRIQPPPALGHASHESNLLSLALGDENDFPAPGGCPPPLPWLHPASPQPSRATVPIRVH